MAPLSEAKATQFLKTLDNGVEVYQGSVDPEWNISSVPFGGYTMGLILNAATKSQSNTKHQDPVHISLQFLRAMAPGPMEVQIENVRVGGQYTNLVAKVYQDGALKNMSSLIFGDLTQTNETLSYPTSHTPLCPLVTHPSGLPVSKQIWPDKFYNRYQMATDPHFRSWNERLAKEGRNDQGMKVGEWVELFDKEPVTADMVPFFMDFSPSPMATLPKDLQAGPVLWWYPTLSIEIQFRARFPVAASFASNTFGVFARKRHMQHGRHNETVELWTAPTTTGNSAKPEEEGWRERMVCVAVGGQMGLIVHPTINDRYAAGKAKL